MKISQSLSKKIIYFWLIPFLTGGFLTTGYRITQKLINQPIMQPSNVTMSSFKAAPEDVLSKPKDIKILPKESKQPIPEKNLLINNFNNQSTKTINKKINEDISTQDYNYPFIPKERNQSVKIKPQISTQSQNSGDRQKEILKSLFNKLPSP